MATDLERNFARGDEERFQRLVSSIEVDGIYMLDCAGHVLTWNRGAQLNKGYASDEVLGKHFKIFFVPEDVQSGVPEAELASAKRQGHFAGEGWRLRKDGVRFWASVVLTAMHSPDGKLIGFSKVIRDISDQKRREDSMRAMQAALQEERDRLYAAAESSLDALFFCEAIRDASGWVEDFVFTYLNSNVEKLVSLPRGKLLGGRMCELLPITLASGLLEKYKDVVETGKPLIEELAIDDGDVKSSWLRIQAVKLRDGVAITASDITERKRNEEKINHLAQHDALTGLPNRNLLDDRTNQAIAFAKRERLMVGFLLIDLDGFKEVNDALGHSSGDEVLCVIAKRLTDAMRCSDSLLRLGGDEFVAIVPGIRQLQELVGVVEKIIDSVRPPIFSANHKILLTCSIGISVYPDSATTGDELLKRADVAMYASKHAGRDQYKFFGHRISAIKRASDRRNNVLPIKSAK